MRQLHVGAIINAPNRRPFLNRRTLALYLGGAYSDPSTCQTIASTKIVSMA
jgi:hypothetical protein